MELASQTPIQIGKKAVLSEFSRITTGLLEVGSMTRPRIVILTGDWTFQWSFIHPMCRSPRANVKRRRRPRSPAGRQRCARRPASGHPRE